MSRCVDTQRLDLMAGKLKVVSGGNRGYLVDCLVVLSQVSCCGVVSDRTEGRTMGGGWLQSGAISNLQQGMTAEMAGTTAWLTE